MEIRVLVAVSIGAVVIAVSAWLLVRTMRQRRAFRLRQQGRGKTAEFLPAE